jgi:hypothetical protein
MLDLGSAERAHHQVRKLILLIHCERSAFISATRSMQSTDVDRRIGAGDAGTVDASIEPAWRIRA